MAMQAGGAATGGDAASESADSSDPATSEVRSGQVTNGFVAADTPPMPAGTVAPIHDQPGYFGFVAAGEQTATCSTLMGLKVVHLRGRIGRYKCENNDCDAPVTEQDVSGDMLGSGDRLRVIHARGPNGFYYKDIPLLNALPGADEGRASTLLKSPLVYFDLDVVTSDPSSLRFYVYKRFQDQPSAATLQPCASDECIDDISPRFPYLFATYHWQLVNKLEDVTGEDPLPQCIVPKMEKMEMIR